MLPLSLPLQYRDEWLEALCAISPLVVIVKANDGYSVYLDGKENYNIHADHHCAPTPLRAIHRAYSAEIRGEK